MRYTKSKRHSYCGAVNRQHREARAEIFGEQYPRWMISPTFHKVEGRSTSKFWRDNETR